MRGGVIDKSRFKVVYVAPMKALAAEVTATFSKRLSALGAAPLLDARGPLQLGVRLALPSQPCKLLLGTSPGRRVCACSLKQSAQRVSLPSKAQGGGDGPACTGCMTWHEAPLTCSWRVCMSVWECPTVLQHPAFLHKPASAGRA